VNMLPTPIPMSPYQGGDTPMFGGASFSFPPATPMPGSHDDTFDVGEDEGEGGVGATVEHGFTTPVPPAESMPPPGRRPGRPGYATQEDYNAM
jgi:hypothetical protein